MSEFKHQPFTDPGNQIRLLQLPATRWGGGMQLNLSTWNVDQAPPYSAISYTWGPDGYPTRSVTINGSNMEVRRKCRFALLQARLRCPGEYIWIDSICIDQTNLAEKKIQVAMMFGIYQKAKQVLACIGESSESSRRLAVVANIIDHMRTKHGLFKDLTTIPESLMILVSRPLIKLLQGLGKGETAQLFSDLSAMSERGYWHRLWIVQEIAAGHGRVQILCGTESISPVGLSLLSKHLEGLGHTIRNRLLDRSGVLFGQIMHSTAHSQLSARSLDDIFTYYADSRCSDARDRIYGVLGLVDWKRHGLQSLMPDYTVSVWRLALRMMKYTNGLALLRAFEIFAHTPEMQALSHSRSLLRPNFQQAPRTAAEDYCVHDKVLHVRHLVAKIRLNPEQALSISPIDTAYDSKPNPAKKRFQHGTMTAWEAMSGQESVSKEVLPKPLFVDQQIAAIACAATLPGDYMIFAGHEDACLIIRKNEKIEHSYDVIGQALVVNGYRLARHGHSAYLGDLDLKALVKEPSSALRCSCSTIPSEPPGSFWADIKIRWTPEDAMLLAGQDLLPNREARDVDGKFARLTTQTLIDPIEAIIMERLVDRCTQCKKLRLFWRL